MKYKNNFFTRIYIVQLFNAYFVDLESRKKAIDKNLLKLIDIDEIFYDEIMEAESIDLNNELKEQIINTYILEEKHINDIREKYQDRDSKGVDYILILIINTAIAEYLGCKTSISIIISEYINICGVFHNATEFVHSILDKVLNSLNQDKNI